MAVDDPGSLEASNDLADCAGDFHRKGPSLVEDMLRGRTVDELHDGLVLHEIDVIQNRHRDPGGSGFRHEARLMTDSRPAQLVVEDVEAVRFRPPIFLDGGPAVEFRRSKIRLRAPLIVDTVPSQTAAINLSSA